VIRKYRLSGDARLARRYRAKPPTTKAKPNSITA
jgi:hypothetical protein